MLWHLCAMPPPSTPSHAAVLGDLAEGILFSSPDVHAHAVARGGAVDDEHADIELMWDAIDTRDVQRYREHTRHDEPFDAACASRILSLLETADDEPLWGVTRMQNLVIDVARNGLNRDGVLFSQEALHILEYGTRKLLESEVACCVARAIAAGECADIATFALATSDDIDSADASMATLPLNVDAQHDA